MPRQLQAIKTTLVSIRITVPGQITNSPDDIQAVDGRIQLQYRDVYADTEETIEIDNAVTQSYNFAELDVPERAALENLIRTFEDQGKARLGLI